MVAPKISRFFLLAGSSLAMAVALAQSASAQDSSGVDYDSHLPEINATNDVGSGVADNLGNHKSTMELDLGYGLRLFDPDTTDANPVQHLRLQNGAGIALDTGSIALLGGGITLDPVTPATPGNITLDGGSVLGLSWPNGPTEAASKSYVDNAIGNYVAPGDDLGSHVATQDLDLSGHGLVNVDDPIDAQDAATKAYVDAVVSLADNLGDHTAHQNLNLANYRIINLPAPVAATDAVNKQYVDSSISTVVASLTTVQNNVTTLQNRRIDTGLGLTGGGDLTADRTIAFNTTWGDARYALVSRTIGTAAGSGLSGGGTLGANLALSVDSSVLRTTGNQSIGGVKSFTVLPDLGTAALPLAPTSGEDAANKAYVDTTVATAVAAVPGDNLGNHTATMILNMTGRVIQNLGTPVVGSDAASKTYVDASITAATSGLVTLATAQTITGAKTFSAVNVFTALPDLGTAATPLVPASGEDAANKAYVDARVAAVPGDNLGNHTATAILNMTGRVIENLATPVAGTDAANKAYVDAQVGGRVATTRSVLSGAGLTGGGDLTVDRTLALTGQALALHNLATNGLFARTGAGTVAARAIAGGAGVTVVNGDGVAGNPTISFDTSSLVALAGAQTVTGAKTFTGGASFTTVAPTFGILPDLGTLALPLVPASAEDATNKAYVDAQVGGRALTTRSILAGAGLTGGGDLSADRTLALTGQALAFHNLAADGLVARTAAGTVASRTLTAGAGITITNGDGIAGNPTISVNAGAIPGDNLGNHTATAALSMATFRVTNLGTPTLATDAATKGYVDTADALLVTMGTTQTITAAKTFTGGAIFNTTAPVFNVLPEIGTAALPLVPVSGEDATNKAYVDTQVGGRALTTRSILAGAGLTGGGDLTADRTLALTGQALALHNVATNGLFARTGVGTVAARTITGAAGVTVTNGDGIAGNPTIAINTSSLVTLATAQTITAAKTFSAAPTFSAGASFTTVAPVFGILPDLGTLALPLVPASAEDATNKAYVDGQVGGRAPTTRSILAGAGLTGGGDLSADRTLALTGQALAFHNLAVNGLTARTAAGAVAARTITGGAGVTVTNGDGVLGNPTIAMDTSSLVALAGAQTVTGAKTFTGGAIYNTTAPVFNVLPDLGTLALPLVPTSPEEATNKAYVDAAILAGRDNLGNHTATQALSMASFAVTNVAAPVAGSDAANKTYVDAQITGRVPTTRSVLAGAGLTGGGDLSVDRTLALTGQALAVHNLATNGLVTRTAAGTVVARTLTAGAGIVITNGDGVLGNPTVAFSGTVPGDNLGNHTATATLNMASFQINNLPDPLLVGNAVNLNYYNNNTVRLTTAQSIAGTKTFLNTPFFDSGYVVIRGNAVDRVLALRDGADVTQVRMFHSATDNNLRLRLQTPDGVTTTSELIMEQDGDMTVKGTGANPSLNVEAAEGIIIARASGNRHLWFRALDGTNQGILYSDDATRSMRLVAYTSAGAWGGNIGVYDSGRFQHNGDYFQQNGSGILIDRDSNKHIWFRNSAGAATGLVYNDTGDNALRLRGYDIGGSGNYSQLTISGHRQGGAFYTWDGATPVNSNRLAYDGNFHATRFYAYNYLYHSDRRLKEDIEPMLPSTALEAIRGLNPVTYTWKFSGDDAMGLIAQEVEEVLPLAVATDDQGMKSIDYSQVVAPLVAAVQALDARVTALETAQAR